MVFEFLSLLCTFEKSKNCTKISFDLNSFLNLLHIWSIESLESGRKTNKTKDPNSESLSFGLFARP